MVCVLDKKKDPRMLRSEKRARRFQERGRSPVPKKYPFTMRRVASQQEDSFLQQLNPKINPKINFKINFKIKVDHNIDLKICRGSKQTGIALALESESTTKVVSPIEFKHRGRQISEPLQPRAAFRRRPGSANLPSDQLVSAVQHLIRKEPASAPA